MIVVGMGAILWNMRNRRQRYVVDYDVFEEDNLDDEDRLVREGGAFEEDEEAVVGKRKTIDNTTTSWVSKEKQ